MYFLFQVLLTLLHMATAFHTPTTTTTTTTTHTRLAAALTPNQIKFLRKEAAQRLARKSLCQVFLPTIDDDDEDTRLLQHIQNEFKQHELVQVRGIARDNIRNVYREAQQLVLELNLVMNVELVETTGHAAILYAPADPPQIVLRSSYKEGQWSKKPKKPRDARGQII